LGFFVFFFTFLFLLFLTFACLSIRASFNSRFNFQIQSPFHALKHGIFDSHSKNPENSDEKVTIPCDVVGSWPT